MLLQNDNNIKILIKNSNKWKLTLFILLLFCNNIFKKWPILNSIYKTKCPEENYIKKIVDCFRSHEIVAKPEALKTF